MGVWVCSIFWRLEKLFSVSRICDGFFFQERSVINIVERFALFFKYKQFKIIHPEQKKKILYTSKVWQH